MTIAIRAPHHEPAVQVLLTALRPAYATAARLAAWTRNASVVGIGHAPRPSYDEKMHDRSTCELASALRR